MLNVVEGLTFDDVLLVPKFSNVSSRSSVDLSVKLSKGFEFSLPIVPANMKDISELNMAIVMFNKGALSILHRFTSIEIQLEWLETIKKWDYGTNFIGFSIGVKEEDFANVDKLIYNGAKIICVDIAHAHSKSGLAMTKYIADKYPNVLLIAGNVATGEGVKDLWRAGADVVKVGIGGGSICTTRTQTGNGVPSLTALSNCYDAKKTFEKELGRPLFLMQDGGLHSTGCISKSLCFADMSMIGNMVSGTLQTPGEIIQEGGIKYKLYSGSSTHKQNHKEGVEALQKYKGSVVDVITNIVDGVSSCCSYQGVYNLTDLKKDPRFVRVTSSGIRESGAHDLSMVIR